MLFSSYEFIFLFLPIALIGYYLFNQLRSPLWGKLWLLLSSLFFYGWWNPAYLPLLIGSIGFNYYISLKIVSANAESNKKNSALLLGLGIGFNLLLLGYFKYAHFFVANISAVSGQHYFIGNIILPLGISFFTIQQIAFLIDSYEEIAQERNFIDYGIFVTFFPHLLAGPILHHKQMMPQFSESKIRQFDPNNFSTGLYLFSMGLFKKVVVADSLSDWVSAGYSLHNSLSFLDAWITTLSYTFQLYFDFSGYVDMAIGVALMFNIRLPQNFDSPYQATSIINFWERWHITLSKFITTYIYTPLIRSFPGRITFSKSMLAILIAMFIAGLWHGAAWTYILFGTFHGFGLVVNHVFRRRKIRMPFWLGWFLTFVFVNVSFVIFRAGDLNSAFTVIKTLFGFGISATGSWFNLPIVTSGSMFSIPVPGSIDNAVVSIILAVAILITLLLTCLCSKNSSSLPERFIPDYKYSALQVFFVVASMAMMDGVTEFVYFQF